MRLGVGSGWYLTFDRGMQGPPAADMLGHLLWGELDLSRNFSMRELVSGQALARREGKGRGCLAPQGCVCVAFVFAELSPGGDCAHSESTAVEELEQTGCGCVCVSPEI